MANVGEYKLLFDIVICDAFALIDCKDYRGRERCVQKVYIFLKVFHPFFIQRSLNSEIGFHITLIAQYPSDIEISYFLQKLMIDGGKVYFANGLLQTQCGDIPHYGIGIRRQFKGQRHTLIPRLSSLEFSDVFLCLCAHHPRWLSLNGIANSASAK